MLHYWHTFFTPFGSNDSWCSAWWRVNNLIQWFWTDDNDNIICRLPYIKCRILLNAAAAPLPALCCCVHPFIEVCKNAKLFHQLHIIAKLAENSQIFKNFSACTYFPRLICSLRYKNFFGMSRGEQNVQLHANLNAKRKQRCSSIHKWTQSSVRPKASTEGSVVKKIQNLGKLKALTV